MSLFDINGNKLNTENSSNVIVGEKIIDTSVIVNTGYSGTLQQQYGSNVNLFGDYIDVSENKVLYYKMPVFNKAGTCLMGFGCYDSEKNFLYYSKNNDSVKNVCLTNSLDNNGIGVDINGTTIYSFGYNMVMFPDEVKYVKLAENPYTPNIKNDLFIIGREPISSLWQTWDDYVTTSTDENVYAVKKVFQKEAKTGVFIGDSLTNWGGGNDALKGFLKIVHEKTGLITKNEGTAGAWWQTGNADDVCAVGRVNTIIAEKRKYDVYCFLMGTNAGSNTDTGETSADTSTMCGAIRYCLETLKAYDPTAQIIVCLPPQRAEGNENQEKVNEVIKKIAESYSVKTLDLYHHSGAVPNTVVAGSNYLSDGLHLGEKGYTVIGDLLASEIKYHLCL